MDLQKIARWMWVAGATVVALCWLKILPEILYLPGLGVGFLGIALSFIKKK